MLIRVIDFETTDIPPDASVCEAAYVDVLAEPPRLAGRPYKNGWQTLVRTETPMSLTALATHHIPEDVVRTSGIPWNSAKATLMGIGTSDGVPDIFAAHNAEFEKAFFNPPDSKWIDTYKVALHLWPDSPSHGNQVLRYYLDLEVGEGASPPHRALPDAWVTAHILIKALEHIDSSVEKLVAWSSEPPYLLKMPFGKYAGQRFDEIPEDYLSWILRQKDIDEGVMAAAQREISR